MEAKLNHLLANAIVEYHKLQGMHWFVSGQDFFQAHAKLEELYDSILPMVDEVAETILQRSGTPVSTLAEVSALASIQERPSVPLTSAEAFATVSQDFASLLEEVTSVKAAADSESDYLVSAQMDGYIAQLSKTLWMLRQQRA